MIETPQAVWFTKGTPTSVKNDVHANVARAVAKRSIPVLVAYNIPFRDCAQVAGGATSPAEYKAWIDGFVAGIGDATAMVILEPDGLGIIPWYDPYGAADESSTLERCQPPEADPDTAASDRFDMLHYAVEYFAAHPGVTTYLDGTHSAWLGSGDIAHRLIQAGCRRRRVLPQRLQLPVHVQQRAVRRMDLGVLDVRDGCQPRRLRRMPRISIGTVVRSRPRSRNSWRGIGIALDQLDEWSDDGTTRR